MSMIGKMTPDEVLARVGEIIEQRRENYGAPSDMFEEIARRWVVSSRRDAALMMADLKMARLRHKWCDDSAIDAMAYLMFAIMFSGD